MDMLSGATLRRIEALSFVSPRAVPAMADPAEVWRLAHRRDTIAYSALVPNRRGAEAALALGGFAYLQAFVAASDGYNRKNVGKSVDESLQDVREVADAASAGGVPVEVSISCAFGDPYEGDVEPERVVEVAGLIAEMGAVGISLGDTTGMANPASVWELVPLIQESLPGLRINCHFHDTRGAGLANVLAAMQCGIEEFDASIGGLGGSPFAGGTSNGNVATEDLVAMLEGMGISTGVDVMALFTAVRMLEKMLGHPVPGRAAKAEYPERGWAAPHEQ
jgi:hydroxymethylglutaryl-CoA lyase